MKGLYETIIERDKTWPDPGFDFIVGLLEHHELSELEKKLTNEHKKELLKKERVHRTIYTMRGFIND